MSNFAKRTILFFVFLFGSNAPLLLAQQQPEPRTLRLGCLFKDNMVLQQQSDAAIWGIAESGQLVSIETSWDNKVTKATAGEDGKWRTTIETPAAGGPYELKIKTDDHDIELTNVLIGEVWICSGQSNMQWKLRGFGVEHFKEDVEKANHPKIRFCQVDQTLALKPKDDVKASWSVCTPKTALEFSAVAYFFGDKLREKLDVPVGLISTNWGGSSGEAWMNQDAILGEFPELEQTLNGYDELIQKHGAEHSRSQKIPKGLNHKMPSVLYNGMLKPLIPFTMRGVIWYQGESNVERPTQYRKLFPKLIGNWRSEWGQGDFPFYFVQIAPYHYRNKELPAALLREAQFQTLKVPNTGMAVTMDIGNPNNIHPKQKKPVGERLALMALANDYGATDLVHSGPQYISHNIESNQIRLKFNHLGSGLASRDGQPLSHFSIAGKDKVFHPASAAIDGDSIRVSSKNVTQPVAVRYGWGNSDEPNMMNKQGLPSSSFRTDNWKIEPKQPKKDQKQKVPNKEPVKKTTSQPNGKPPNIVLMISDELAYYELSHMGNKKIHTPNIDQMAREGIRFTQALAAAPVCGPLRCCLMTGKHMGHASMRTNGGGTPIRADEPTIASMLKSQGYVTGGFGKWGIGGRGSEGIPESHGFDEFFGYYDQVHAHSFFTPHLIRNSKEVPLPGNNGGRTGETYSHYEIMKEGLQFIRKNKDQPFFCYLPVTPPHGMYDIPADDPAFELYKDDEWMQNPKIPQDAKNYAAMVSMIDNDLKRVLDLLKELSLDDKTIVFFTGDNGGQDRFVDDQHPRGFFGPNVNPKTGVEFRGQKRSLYEGALRIPFLVRWPGKIEKGQASDHLFYQVDMMATLAELTQTKLPVETDGISFCPTLLGTKASGREQEQHEYMYWEYQKQVAVRKGNWKAIKPSAKSDWELYDLNSDISESIDLAAKNPNLVAELAAFAKKSHVVARPGKFLRGDLQKRDRTAKWKKPEPLTQSN
jgi:sialate O-acetylesterase